MNNKGFTIIELLAVIIILGILLALVTTAVLNISTRIREKSYNNLVSEINDAAENYATDTNKKIFFVQELIDNGYIEAEENGFVYSPKNKNIRVNCYPIEVDFYKGVYSARIVETTDYEIIDESCDEEGLKMSDINFSISKISNNKLSINCPNGSDILLVSNKGLYEPIHCTSVAYIHDFSLTDTTTFTISLRLSEENYVKTRSITVKGDV